MVAAPRVIREVQHRNQAAAQIWSFLRTVRAVPREIHAQVATGHPALRASWLHFDPACWSVTVRLPLQLRLQTKADAAWILLQRENPNLGRRLIESKEAEEQTVMQCRLASICGA